MNSSLARSRPVSSRIISARCAVCRGVERRKLVAERQIVAVALDEVGHVVAIERLGESLERPAHRVARREGAESL